MHNGEQLASNEVTRVKVGSHFFWFFFFLFVHITQAQCEGRYVGAIVCKLELHNYNVRRGYIAMLAVDKNYRKKKIGEPWRDTEHSINRYAMKNENCLTAGVLLLGSTLVKKSIQQMVANGCDQVCVVVGGYL